jgi:hypothetical protein
MYMTLLIIAFAAMLFVAVMGGGPRRRGPGGRR